MNQDPTALSSRENWLRYSTYAGAIGALAIMFKILAGGEEAPLKPASPEHELVDVDLPTDMPTADRSLPIDLSSAE